MPPSIFGQFEATIADLSAFERLPQETLDMCERVFRHRVEAEGDRYYASVRKDALDAAEERGYRRGLADGRRQGSEAQKMAPPGPREVAS